MVWVLHGNDSNVRIGARKANKRIPCSISLTVCVPQCWPGFRLCACIPYTKQTKTTTNKSHQLRNSGILEMNSSPMSPLSSSSSSLSIILIAAVTITIIIILYYPPRILVQIIQQRTPVLFFNTEKRVVQNKMIALTIDDSPRNWDYTRQILRTLRQHNVRVTFFVIGSQMLAMEELMKQIIEDGHEIQNHGWTGVPACLMSDEGLRKEMESTHDYTKRKYGVEFKFYRPAFGIVTSKIIQHANSRGYRIVLGDVYPHDPQVPIPSVNAAHVLSKVQPGSVIILHDRAWTPRALDVILPRLLEKGYQFVSLSEMFRPE